VRPIQLVVARIWVLDRTMGLRRRG